MTSNCSRCFSSRCRLHPSEPFSSRASVTRTVSFSTCHCVGKSRRDRLHHVGNAFRVRLIEVTIDIERVVHGWRQLSRLR
ncbi:hypothetical protein M404DRAFT_999327 [Pisolithus tinctorius Marx 270]|uniref:Uncharacterized protein n=1 Tax=Pisolithus tinctorius Marx 270 TaxID=870435 RepID=A0A0C3NZ34_PISTI|nr:hypothetical protein M404DRAFT_999327 [Pisolithus tinctorius Marx 270]